MRVKSYDKLPAVGGGGRWVGKLVGRGPKIGVGIAGNPGSFLFNESAYMYKYNKNDECWKTLGYRKYYKYSKKCKYSLDWMLGTRTLQSPMSHSQGNPIYTVIQWTVDIILLSGTAKTFQLYRKFFLYTHLLGPYCDGLTWYNWISQARAANLIFRVYFCIPARMILEG